MTVHENSLEIYRAIEECGYISKNGVRTWKFIADYPGKTAMEIDALFKHGKDRPLAPPRITELKEAGLVTESGRRTCTVTGHTASTYTITNKLPEPTPSWPSKADWKRDHGLIRVLVEVYEQNGWRVPPSIRKLLARLDFDARA